MPKLSKSLPSGTAEDGIHLHLLDIPNEKTAKDGAHKHKFQLPDGTVLETEEGGEHSHYVDTWGGEIYIWWSGKHTHKLVYPDGNIQWTSFDGEHSHQPQPTSTAFDGVHTHTLVYIDGTVLQSLNSKDIYDLLNLEFAPEEPEAKSPPASVLAAIAKSDRSCEIRLSDAGLHFDIGETSLTLSAVVAKVEGQIDVKKAVSSWEPRVFGVGAFPVGKSAPKTGTFVCKGTISPGVIAPDRVELFVESEDFVKRMELTPTPAGWVCKLSMGAPLALTHKHKVPPKGISGLPLGIEKQIPENVRYWDMEDRELAQKAMDWLVESKFATAEEMAVAEVAGSYALVSVDKAVYEFLPDPTKVNGAATWTQKMVSCLPKDVPVVSPFAEEDWRAEVALFRKSRVLFLMDVPNQDDVEDACTLVAKSKFVIGADDTPANRERFKAIGQVFKIRDAGAFDKLYATNVDIESTDIIPIYADAPLPVVKVVAGQVLRPTEKSVPELDRMNKSASNVRVVKKGDTDERYVLGVVAEPEETDTQGDTQKAETIKKAAYSFLEDFRNIGLQHKAFINGSVKIVESYIARADEGQPGDANYVKKGSWLMAVRVLDDALWKSIKTGDITGFSFGGYAERVPIEKN